jgi:dTDP-glucose pyrophosphorylase
MMAKNWKMAMLPASATIEDVVRNLDQVAVKISMIVDDSGLLIGTISDGDIRRGLLKGLNLRSPIDEVVHKNALVVTPDLARDMVLELMSANKVQQIPVVNEKHQVVGLHLWEDLSSKKEVENIMVIMAGGKGTRLLPDTEQCPKPMLLVAGKPMLEHVIENAKLAGFQKFILAIHHMGHIIENHFGDGAALGVNIDYLREETPMGTAGALSLLTSRFKDPFIVTNGDVLTDIRYDELLDFHIRQSAIATMAVRLHEWQNPFGVVQTNGAEITGIDEKPIVRSHINAGVYVFEPQALGELSKNSHCDMPELFEKLRLAELRTVAYPMHEPWLDVGRHSDLKEARNTR